MRRRADVDEELRREKRAIADLEKSEFRWSRHVDRPKRDAHIMELWALGLTREEIGERVDLTPQRVSQIVHSFGVGWPHV
jgi:hypothetical protein